MWPSSRSPRRAAVPGDRAPPEPPTPSRSRWTWPSRGAVGTSRAGSSVDGDRHDRRPISVRVRCTASLARRRAAAGRARSGCSAWTTYWDIRTRGVPVWLDEEVFRRSPSWGRSTRRTGCTSPSDLPGELPDAVEGTFVAFRWTVEARRQRLLGSDVGALPLLRRAADDARRSCGDEPDRIWRLLEWRSELDVAGSGGPCSVTYEERRAEDMPLPGEAREQELARPPDH